MYIIMHKKADLVEESGAVGHIVILIKHRVSHKVINRLQIRV